MASLLRSASSKPSSVTASSRIVFFAGNEPELERARLQRSALLVSESFLSNQSTHVDIRTQMHASRLSGMRKDETNTRNQMESVFVICGEGGIWGLEPGMGPGRSLGGTGTAPGRRRDRTGTEADRNRDGARDGAGTDPGRNWNGTGAGLGTEWKLTPWARVALSHCVSSDTDPRVAIL